MRNPAEKKDNTFPMLTKAALNFIKNNQPDEFNHYRPFFLAAELRGSEGRNAVPTDAPFSEEPWPQPEKNQAAIIARLDGYIGQLLEQLQKLGMTNNAVIFFTSDATSPKKAGGVDPDFFHSNISTNDLRVPMIVHWPGTIPAGQVSGFNWSAQDFLPTAAEIAFTKPQNIDGNSVLPTLRGCKPVHLKSFCAGLGSGALKSRSCSIHGEAHPHNRQHDEQHNRRQHKPRPFVISFRGISFGSFTRQL
jgi:arylsulfatase A-like enzyme